MPGLRFVSLSEMQQNTFSKAEQRTCQSSGKRVAANRPCKLAKRARLASEPLTPENKPTQKTSRIASALPGSHIHLSQSADGKLRWNPPSSSTSSTISEGREISSCFSTDFGPVTIVSPAPGETELEKSVLASKNSLLSEGEKHACSEAGPCSSSLTSCCCNRISLYSSAADTAEDSDVQEVSFGLNQQATSSSELSTSLPQHEIGGKKSVGGVLDPLSSRACGLSPYLSSRLKPGKHILGVKKNQNYIRPGQLRHWAVGNSPSLKLSNLPASSLKGKACRNLAF